MSRFAKVLVIDDTDADQLLADIAIHSYNPAATIVQAKDGEEALAVLRGGSATPDLILLDINMPRMNGLEFLEEYCGKGQGSPVVVMLTSSDQSADRVRTSSYDCVVDYQLKPLEVATLELLEQKIRPR